MILCMLYDLDYFRCVYLWKRIKKIKKLNHQILCQKNIIQNNFHLTFFSFPWFHFPHNQYLAFSSTSLKGYLSSILIPANSRAIFTNMGTFFSSEYKLLINSLKQSVKKYLKNYGTLSSAIAFLNFFIILRLKLILCMDNKWQKLSCFWIMCKYARV